MSMYAVLQNTHSILDAIREINRVSTSGGEAGIAVILEDGKAKGVVTDGDIRWAICEGLSLDQTVTSIASTNFCFVYSDLNKEEQLSMALSQLGNSPRNKEVRLLKVVVLDRKGSFIRFTNLYDIYRYSDQSYRQLS